MRILRVENFLGTEASARLLAYAIDHELQFEPSRIGSGTGHVNPGIRVSRKLRDLGAPGVPFEQRMLESAPRLSEQLGITSFAVETLEIELIAHGDGAFYKRHIDLFTGGGRHPDAERMVSAVYYLNRQPKPYSGGALQLYPVGRDNVEPIAIEPEHDLLIAFPSWVPHEVLPVACESTDFADSRFAINCWVMRARAPPD